MAIKTAAPATPCGRCGHILRYVVDRAGSAYLRCSTYCVEQKNRDRARRTSRVRRGGLSRRTSCSTCGRRFRFIRRGPEQRPLRICVASCLGQTRRARSRARYFDQEVSARPPKPVATLLDTPFLAPRLLPIPEPQDCARCGARERLDRQVAVDTHFGVALFRCFNGHSRRVELAA